MTASTRAMPRHRSLCIVIHDVAPQTWPRCQTLLDKLSRIGHFPVTLLAVPRYHGAARDAAFEAWLLGRANQGDEVALHGYTHLDDGTPRGMIDRLRRRVYTRGEGEFWDLSRDEARHRLDAGMAWLASLGIMPAGFVAPAWLMGDDAWAALRDYPFEYTCTLKRFCLLPTAAVARLGPRSGVASQAQVYSSSTAWRRWLSVIWCGWLARVQRGSSIVRLELHPVDLKAPVLRSWLRLAREQAETRRVETMLSLARRLRAEQVRTTPASMSP